MAIRSGFFNSIAGDRLYSAAEFAEYFAAFIGSGVFPDPSSSLQIQPATGLQVKIKAGKAWINGYILISDADTLETLTAEAVLNRMDRLVVRLHFSNRNISVVRKIGTPASNPVAPGVTRDAEMIELSLANISIPAGLTTITSEHITDTRSDPQVCGFVSSTITNIPYLTPGKVLISDAEGELGISGISASELASLAGIQSAIQDQLNAKQPTLTGAASTIVGTNLSANRVVVSDGNGKLGASSITSTELGTLAGVSTGLQSQINGKQGTITGAASSVVTTNLSPNKVLTSDGSGKIVAASTTTSELGFLSGVTSAIQAQLKEKLSSTAQAADSLKIGGKKLTVGTTAPSNPAIGDIWIDTN
jgi:hypothetical protein